MEEPYDIWCAALKAGKWHPPIARRTQIDEHAYSLRSEGLSYREIGKRMGTTREHVRQRVARHDAALRRKQHRG